MKYLDIRNIFSISIILFIELASQTNFDLNNNGTSFIFWPFPNSQYVDPTHGTNNWAVYGSYHGEDAHLGSDYYAADWGLPGDSDCGVDKLAPFNGTVIYVGDTGNGYGNQVVIRASSNGDFAYRVAHLSAISVVLNQSVMKGQKLGEIGTTGASTGCHSHSVLYKNISQIYSGSQTALERLQLGGTLGISGSPNQFAANYNFSATAYPETTYEFKVNTIHQIAGWKFWKNSTASYTISFSMSQYIGNYAIILVNELGQHISDIRTNIDSINLATMEFNVNAIINGRYRFRIIPQYVPSTVWYETETFFINSLPTLNMNISPLNLVIGQNAMVTWSVGGGINGLPNGGWTGNIRLQWYQNDNPLGNLTSQDGVPVSDGSFTFNVPNQLQGATIPGGNFKIWGANADTGTSIPSGNVSAPTQTFSIVSGVSNFNISPSTLTFGTVPINEPKILTVILSNGTISTQNFVGYVNSVNSPFSIVWGAGNFSIPPGDTALIKIKFSPNQTISYKDTLVISHNGNNSPKRIPLIGSGTTTTEKFIVTPTPIPGSEYGKAIFVDMDGDADLDLIVGGTHVTSYGYYVNNNGQFTLGLLNISAPPRGSIQAADADGDGDIDILMCGSYSGTPKTYLAIRYNTFFDYIQLPGVIDGFAAFVDYDNDGDLDIYINGMSSEGRISKLMRKEGNQFIEVPNSITPLEKVSGDFGDFNRDGKKDLVISGYNGTNDVTKIYKNENGVFVEISSDITPTERGSIRWGDFNNDGNLDILVTGEKRIGPSFWFSEIYVNNNGQFDPTLSSITPVGLSDGIWGDFNNDGLLDCFIMGQNQSMGGLQSEMYLKNDGNNNIFSRLNYSFPKLYYGSATAGDIDNDGDLDLFLIGLNSSNQPVSYMLINNFQNVNLPPSTPQGLNTIVNQNNVSFEWNESTDDKTPAAGLSYNVRIGTTPNGNQIFSSNSNDLGFHKISKVGNIDGRKSLQLKNLPGGILYWSVQALDKSYSASEFSPPIQFSIPIPVELLSFNGMEIGNQIVSLNWLTATETNNSGFEVHRAEHREGDFNQIGFVKGSGTITEETKYNFRDNIQYISDSKEVYYRLKQIDYDGSYTYSDTIRVKLNGKPTGYDLSQNYPNPFNPSTMVSFQLPEAAHVRLELFDILGQKVETIIDQTRESGYYTTQIKGESLDSGTYLLRLMANNKLVKTIKISVVK